MYLQDEDSESDGCAARAAVASNGRELDDQRGAPEPGADAVEDDEEAGCQLVLDEHEDGEDVDEEDDGDEEDGDNDGTVGKMISMFFCAQ